MREKQSKGDCERVEIENIQVSFFDVNVCEKEINVKFPKINVLLCYIINEYIKKMIIVKKIIIINSNELFESMFTFMIVEFFLIRTYLIWKAKK